jgi:hypothetical protein
MTTTTPYQKYLAYWFPTVPKVESSRISCKKSNACVSLEKSTPAEVNGDEDDGLSPPISMSMVKAKATEWMSGDLA